MEMPAGFIMVVTAKKQVIVDAFIQKKTPSSIVMRPDQSRNLFSSLTCPAFLAPKDSSISAMFAKFFLARTIVFRIQ